MRFDRFVAKQDERLGLYFVSSTQTINLIYGHELSLVSDEAGLFQTELGLIC